MQRIGKDSGLSLPLLLLETKPTHEPFHPFAMVPDLGYQALAYEHSKFFPGMDDAVSLERAASSAVACKRRCNRATDRGFKAVHRPAQLRSGVDHMSGISLGVYTLM